MEKYLQLAKDLKMEHALLIGPKDIYFDSRAVLKCLWGCEEHTPGNIRCSTRDSTLSERIDMIKSYHNILLLHSHDAAALSSTVLEIERVAFLDGYYFAAGMRGCNLCKECSVKKGQPCPTPKKLDHVSPVSELICIRRYVIWDYPAKYYRTKPIVRTAMALFLSIN